MKGFMTLVFFIIVASTAAYFVSPEFKKEFDEQVFYRLGLMSHESYGYKWQDEKGAWQLTQEPPPAGIPFEKVEARDDWNVLDVPERLK